MFKVFRYRLYPTPAQRERLDSALETCRRFYYPQGDSNEPQKMRENKGIQDAGGTDSGTLADAGKVEALAAAFLSLSPEDRARLAAMLSGQGQGG